MPLRQLTDPDQVVKAMVVCHPVVQDPEELLAWLWALCTPPEPATLSLVQCPPKYGDVGSL